MRPRTLLVLAAVVLALAAFIRFYERDLPSSDERAQRAKRVLDLKKDQVTRVRIEADGNTVVLERQAAARPAAGSKPAAPATPATPAVDSSASGNAATGAATSSVSNEWRITRPLVARADTAAVDRLLDSLANLEKSRTLEQVIAAEVGLDKPRAKVTLTTGGGHETVLEVGAAVPTGGETIVAVTGRPEAFVVGDTVLSDLRKKPGEWRDRQMFHGDRDRIERVSWTLGSAPRVVLAKRGDRFWLEGPISDRADRDQVEKLLTDLTGLSAESFVDSPGPAPSQPWGLDPPRAVVEAVLAGEPRPFHVELGASHAAAAPPAQPGTPESTASLTYARLGGTVFETRSGLAETLARPPADWRSPLLSGLEVHQVEAAVVRDGGGVLSLTRAGTDWKRGAVTISYLPVSDLLFTVTESKAERLLTAAQAQAVGAGTGKPQITFELKGGAAGNETLTLYPAPSGGSGGSAGSGASAGVPARAAGRDSVLMLPASKLKDIQDRLAAVRAAPPLAAPKPAKK